MIPSQLKDTSIFYVPDFQRYEAGNVSILLDPEGPNWIGTDARGAEIIGLLDGKTSLGEVARIYSSRYGVEGPKAWLHVYSFIKDALRQRFLSTQPFHRDDYPGRNAFLSLNGLKELWLYINNACNLRCTHCLVESSPKGETGLPTDALLELIRQAKALGVTQFYFTGGEPFLRPDLFRLISYATQGGSRATILTNGVLLGQKTVKWLSTFPPGSIKLQISLDGSNPEVNDPIRGRGSFEAIIRGVRKVVEGGHSPTVATVLLPENLHDLPELLRLLHDLGVTALHLLYPHRRGRFLLALGQLSTVELAEALFRVRAMASEMCLTIDNFSVLAARLHAPRFTRFDLSTACWDSLCVYTNGEVYPSAVFTGHKALYCGNIRESSLEEIWRRSPTCQHLRSTTLKDKSHCRACPLKFLCGGGDIEYAYFASGANLLGLDPYCELYKEIIFRLLKEWVQEAQRNSNSGSDVPRVYLGMGERSFCCQEED
ncbi:MAG TPA: PqqD family peptide modification chaperone, partial [Candidatus Hypogeohydataceae bacterium YC38]